MRFTLYFLCSGLSATTIWIVEQLGLAMILSFAVSISAFSSGTTSRLVGSIRQAEELSTTVIPAAANFGAHSSEVLPPAENRASAGFAAIASAALTTVYFLPLNSTCFPTDLSDATGSNSVTGKFLSANTCNIFVPTSPVAPTTATFIVFLLTVDGPAARFEQKSLPARREGCDYLGIQNDQTLARSSKPFLTIFVCFINFICGPKVIPKENKSKFYLVRCLDQLDVEVHQVDELPDPRIDIGTGDLLQPRRSKLLHAKRCHGRTDDDRSLHVLEGDIPGMGQMTDETARTRISCTGGIKDLFQRQCRCDKDLVAMEKQRTVLALFDDQVFRPHGEDLPGCFDKRELPAELARFAVVDQHYIDHGQQLFEIIERRIHPKVHGIHGDQSGPLLQLLDYAYLQAGIHIAQHQELAPLVGGGDHGIEVEQNIQIGDQGIPGIHVQVVFPAPEKRFLVFFDLHAFQVGPAFL